jgi:DNA-binding response OmpR family regulator
MMRVLLINPPENQQSILQGWEAGDEITLDLLPEEMDLREALSKQRYDIAMVQDDRDDVRAIETLQRIRRMDASIPLIFLTGTLDIDLGANALNAGADCYLWDYTRERYQDLLVPVIKNLVQRHRREEQVIGDNLIMRAIHDASPVAACVIKDHRISWVNALIPRKLGYTKEDLIGSDPLRLFPSEEEHRRIDTGL